MAYTSQHGWSLSAEQKSLERTKIDLIQKCQVQRLPDDVGRALGKHHMSAVIALFQRVQNIFRIVRLQVIVTLDIASLCSFASTRQRSVRPHAIEADLRSWAWAWSLGKLLWQAIKVLLVRCPGGSNTQCLQHQE